MSNNFEDTLEEFYSAKSYSPDEEEYFKLVPTKFRKYLLPDVVGNFFMGLSDDDTLIPCKKGQDFLWRVVVTLEEDFRYENYYWAKTPYEAYALYAISEGSTMEDNLPSHNFEIRLICGYKSKIKNLKEVILDFLPKLTILKDLF